MTFPEWQHKIKELWQSPKTTTDLIQAQRAIVDDSDLSVYDKGYLLAGFINHPEAPPNSVPDQVALVGGLFESEALASRAKANGLLAEATALLNGAAPSGN